MKIELEALKIYIYYQDDINQNNFGKYVKIFLLVCSVFIIQ